MTCDYTERICVDPSEYGYVVLDLAKRRRDLWTIQTEFVNSLVYHAGALYGAVRLENTINNCPGHYHARIGVVSRGKSPSFRICTIDGEHPRSGIKYSNGTIVLAICRWSEIITDPHSSEDDSAVDFPPLHEGFAMAQLLAHKLNHEIRYDWSGRRH